MYFRAWYEFQKADIVIPFPQQDVWFKNNLKVEIDKEIVQDMSMKNDNEEDK
jgi:small-conductance mechanosensitive channel